MLRRLSERQTSSSRGGSGDGAVRLGPRAGLHAVATAIGEILYMPWNRPLGKPSTGDARGKFLRRTTGRMLRGAADNGFRRSRDRLTRQLSPNALPVTSALRLSWWPRYSSSSRTFAHGGHSSKGAKHRLRVTVSWCFIPKRGTSSSLFIESAIFPPRRTHPIRFQDTCFCIHLPDSQAFCSAIPGSSTPHRLTRIRSLFQLAPILAFSFFLPLSAIFATQSRARLCSRRPNWRCPERRP